MDNIKLSVTFELPGSTMLTSQECEENPKENYTSETITYFSPVQYKDGKKTKTKYVKETMKINVRKSIPAKQCINMTMEAYQEMISNTPIPGVPPSTWKKLTKNERIIAHLERIAKDLNSTNYQFTILDD